MSPTFEHPIIMYKNFIFGITVAFFFPFVSRAQQTDPTLTAAIIAQTEELKSAYKKRDKTQTDLAVVQSTVTAAMGAVHEVEKKTLEYMSNASSAMQNLYQLKRAAELVGEKIPSQIKEMVNAVPSNLQGTAITTLTTKTCENVIEEMSSLYGFMSQLVTSTSYSFSDKKDTETSENGKNNVNLLSAAERYYIANEVVRKLEKLYNRLWATTYHIKTMGWEDGLKYIDYNSWSNANQGKKNAEYLIQQWKNAKFNF